MSSPKPIQLILARQLCSSLAVPILLVDTEGTLIFYNEPAEVILDQRFEESGEMAADTWSGRFALADEERKQVVFQFRFDPGTVLPRHRHKCHAIAYTVSGEWEYEGLRLPAGALAYEPVESEHTPSSEPGAELVVFLKSETDDFLVNYMPDGSEIPMDMGFFKALEGASQADIERLSAELTDDGAA